MVTSSALYAFDGGCHEPVITAMVYDIIECTNMNKCCFNEMRWYRYRIIALFVFYV